MLAFPLLAMAQRPTIIRTYADTFKVLVFDNTGAEFALENDTKDSTGGVLTNVLNGRTQFRKLRMKKINDSTYVLNIGTNTTTGDTIRIKAVAVDVSTLLVKTNNLSDLTNTSTARTNLGATTIGVNIFTSANPSAITFLRANADNTVTWRSASNFRTDIGAGTGDGDALTSNPLSQFAPTTSSQLASTLSDEYGTGPARFGRVMDTSYSFLNATRDSMCTIITINGVSYRTCLRDSISPITATSTTTFTNKRITARYGSTTSSATPTINTDNVDVYELTAQTVDITSFTTNLSGTPTTDQTLHIIITGTAARAITWGSSFEASTVALPTTTVSTNRLDVYFVYTAGGKWRCGGTW